MAFATPEIAPVIDLGLPARRSANRGRTAVCRLSVESGRLSLYMAAGIALCGMDYRRQVTADGMSHHIP
jgi:hypothetical protein